MLAGRLLAVGGSGSFVTPVPPPDALEVFTISAAPDGAWTWFGDPRAITVDGVCYIGYVDTSGNVCVRTYEESSETTGAEIILKAALDVDDHVNPSFLVRPDGKLAAFYARHEPLSTTMHMRVSVDTLATDPLLANGFAAEVSLDAQLGAGSYDYPVPFYLSGSSTIYLFWRDIPSGSSYRLNYSTSADGDTWASRTVVFINTTHSGRAYWKLASNGVDEIHIAMTDGSPNTETTHLAHFYFDGTWRESDGTSLGALPLDFADLTPVFSSTNSWVWDIVLDPVSGHPRIVFPSWPVNFADVRYRYAAWDGSAWDTDEITTGGGGIDGTGVYSGGIVIDPQDPDTIYCSRVVSSQWELWRYVTTNGGDTWTGDALTTGSGSKNVRPIVPKDAELLRVIWMTGTYTGYTSFNTGLTGARTP